MTTATQRIRIGIFVLVGAMLAALVLVVFGGVHLLRRHVRYYIEFDGSVYGLEDGAEVYYDGVRVGSVATLQIEGNRGVRVGISVDARTPVRTDTKAVTLYAGITGLKVIDLRDGSPEAPRLPSGGTIGSAESELDRLERKLLGMAERSSRLLSDADRLVKNLADVTDPARLGTLVSRSQTTVDNLAQASAELRVMLDENRGALHDSIASVDRAARSTSALLDGPISSVVANIDKLASQLGTVVHDEGAQVHATLSDLRQASRSFKDLVREIRSSPSRLLFSQPQPDRKLP